MAQQTRGDRAAANAATRRNTPADPDAAPGTDLAVKDPLEKMIDSWSPQIEKQFPLHLKLNPDAWMRVALSGMRNSKQAKALAACTRPSLYAALLESARYGLTPFTDEAAIVPYKDTATFIPMAQGFIKMFYNSGQVAAVVVDFIRKGEKRGVDWQVSRGAGGKGFFHNPKFFNDDDDETPFVPGEPIIAYCYLVFRDGSIGEPAIVPKWDAIEVMQTRSRAWQYAEHVSKKKDSLWHTDFPAMWRKTAVRRAAKYGPKSAELQELLLVEAREDIRRSDAPPPRIPKGAPPIEGAGVDWTGDINGGNVTPGTVVPDSTVPDESQMPAQPRSRRSNMAQINAIFGKHGLDGKDNQAMRRAVISALLYVKGEPMVLIATAADLTDEETAKVAARLAESTDAEAAAGRDVGAALRKTAEMAVAAAERDAGGSPGKSPAGESAGDSAGSEATGTVKAEAT